MTKHKTNKSLLSRLGFTLTELIVVIAILGILATISFIMLQGYIQTSRDSVRVSDINSVSKALTLYDAKTGSFPEPDGAISINYGTDGVVWRQGKVGESVVRNIRMNKITLDPHFDAEYTYSVTPDKKSYQIASLIETDTIALNPTIAVDRAYAGDNAFLAYIKGNYNELAAKVVDDTGTCKLFLAVPSIILADLNTANGTIDIKNPSQVGSGSLVFMKKENLPASYSGYLSDGSDLAGKFTFKDFSGSGAVLLDGCDSASLEAVGADICTTIGKTCTKDEKLAYASTALANSLKEFYGNTSIASGDSYSSFTQSADGTPLAELGSNIARNDLGISMKPLSASVLGSVTFTCAAQPDIANADPSKYSIGNPASFNQEWIYSNEPGNCTFACKSGYAYDSKTNSCVLDICQGDLALLNGHMVSGSTQSATKPWVHSTVAGVCAYDCNEGYTWNGSTCAPDPCAPRVITSGDGFKFDIKNAMNSGDELGVTSDAKEILGGTITATETFVCTRGSISERPDTYVVALPTCQAHYSVKGYTCDPEVRTFNCVDASRPANSEWSGLSGYEQTWDGTVFSPVDSDPTYGAGVAGKCMYKCSSGFHTEDGGDSCVSNTDLTTCTVAHGNGIRTWNTTTNAWGACSVNTCNTGYVEQAGACVADNCDGTPPAHSVSNSTSQKFGVTWKYNLTAGQCTFKCDTNYQWDSQSSSCVAMKRNVNCGGAIATNATASTATTYQQTWDGDLNQWLPGTSWSHGAASCGYTCNANYTWDGTVCVADTREFTCSNILPAHAEWNTVSKYSQTWDGGGWNPVNSTTGYSLSPASDSCRFKCSSGYHTEDGGASCVPNSQACTVTNGSGVKTWNDGSASWSVCIVNDCANGYAIQSNQCVPDICNGTMPDHAASNGGQSVSASWHYSTTYGTCAFKCNANYNWDGSACVANTQVVSCGGSIASNASAATAVNYTQTWNGSAWSPSTSWTFGGSSCGFACNAHYTWNSGSSTCVADQNVYTCANTKPANSSWNTVASYTQTWNGSAWSPAASSPTYSTTPSTTSCTYSCNTGYHTEDSGVSCVSNTRSCTISNGSGQQTWGGSSWGSCTVTACNSGYVEQSNMCVADVCGGTVPANATSNATGQTVSKNWAYNTTPGQCTFKCDNNYNWSGGACVAGTQTYTCPTATNPANKVWNTVASYTQTWNGSAWMPAGTSTIYSTSADTQSCRVACGSGYHTEDSGSTCISNTKSCTIANGTGSQTWNGSTWGTCTLVSCDSNYHASGNTCVADAQNANCSGSVPTNASASATTFTQTWNGSAWTPTTTNYAYQAANCGYTCNINFHTEDSGASCTGNTRSCTITNGVGSQSWGGSSWGACVVSSCNGGYVNSSNTCVLDVCGGSVPANATSNATVQHFGTNWTYSASAGQCTFICNAHYTWNSGSSTCVADIQTYTCSAKPANTDWNTVASYTQTWNGSAWIPTSSSTTYNTASSVSECRYKCSTGYHWNSGSSACDADVISCALPTGAASATQTWNGSAYGSCVATSCNANYTLSSGACSANTQVVSCGGSIAANASATTATTYTQTWNGSAWTPTTSWSRGAGTCGWGCNSGYNWDGSACSVKIDGTCNNSVALGCSTGAGYTSDNGATGCGTTRTWYCAGSNAGATSVQCSKANAACINGSCNSVFNSYTTPTATCAAGNPTSVTGSGPWYWGCNSPNGGTSTSATACSANKKVDCVGAWSACSNGSQTYSISVSAANGGTACGATNGATQSCGTTGSCGGTAGTCAVGSPVSVVNNGCGSTTTWTCTGVSGGSNVACSVNNAACPVNGSCSSTKGACNAGNAASDNGSNSCGTNRTWNCNGLNGGTTANCSVYNGACPVNGACNNSTALGCSAGSAYSDNGSTSCGTNRTWYCSGANGGSNSSQCALYNGNCPVNGVCSGTPGACSAGGGAYSDNGLTSCGTTRTWNCYGSYGGSNVSCSSYNGACPVNGSCSSTKGACNAGNAASDNGSNSCGTNRTWNCNGLNGGTTANCSVYNGACPVNCSASWSDTSTCNASCGGGVKQQVYTIYTYPANGGAACEAGNGATRWGSTGCNTQACSVPCSYSLSYESRNCYYDNNSCQEYCDTGCWVHITNAGTTCSVSEGQLYSYGTYNPSTYIVTCP